MLEQLQQFLQGTFQKDCAATSSTEKRMCSQILNNGDEHVDRKDSKERMARYTSTFYLFIGYMEGKENECTVRCAHHCPLSLHGWRP